MKTPRIARTAAASLASVAMLAALGGCSFAVRSPDMYRDDTAKVLATKSPEIQACYDGILKGKPGTAGKATVKFSVEVKTGAFTDVAIDKANTTVPDDVAACVTHAMAGLALAPADSNNGEATFVYEFTAPAAAAPAAAAPATPAAAPAAAAPAAAAPAAAAPAAVKPPSTGLKLK
ncbi:MAG: AgmX/PglI C-terminal domain-containing protein [Myxococcales bacterium]|nr:AgmX/PglI C-terminal domain-containing protein [Myxococcales bacterium]